MKTRLSWLLKYLGSETNTVRLLIYGYLILTVACFFLLVLPFSHENNIALIDHFFLSVSLVSTTGLVSADLASTYNMFGEIVALVMIQLGGIGYMAIMTYIFAGSSKRLPVLSMRLLRLEFGLPRKYPMVEFIYSVVAFTIFIESLGAFLLYRGFSVAGVEQPLWNAIFHSVSAFCTAGFSLFSESFVGFSDNPLITSTIVGLSLLGSIGFIIIVDIYLWITRQKKSFSLSSRLILTSTFFLLVAGSFFLYLSHPDLWQQEGWQGVHLALFQAMSAHTTVGFNSYDFGAFGAEALFICMILMLIGASPAGTGGGIKTTTVSVLLGVMKSILLKRRRITFFNSTIPQDRLMTAIASFTFYSLVLGFLTWVLFNTDGHRLPFEDLLFESISALGTVGLSTGITADLSNWGKVVVCVMMFIGRIGVITFGLSIRKYEVSGQFKPSKEEDLAL